MRKKNKEFYVWTVKECIKDMYENWGTDMMSMYSYIQADFPNAADAITKIYTKFTNDRDCYQSEAITFEKVEYVYQAIANIIPNHKVLRFNFVTKNEAEEYEFLKICSFENDEPIERIDLMMTIMLFTEEFILWPIKNERVISSTETELSIMGNFVTLKICIIEEKTYVSIIIEDVILLQYIMHN